MGLFDYVKDPVPFLKKMAGMTRRRVIASFPAFSVLRSPQRKLRYALLHRCPVYFYTPGKLKKILADAGLGDARIVKLKGGPGADMLADIELS